MSSVSPSEMAVLPAAWRKYWKILRISLVERLVYRVDVFVTTFFRFLPLLTTFLLWEAIFDGSGQDEISGFTRQQMIAYLLMVQVSRMASSMPGLAGGIARDIRDGNLKKYLIQPIDMIAYLLSFRVAHKIAYIMTAIIPYGVLFYLCRDSFTGFPDPLTLGLYVLSLLMGFLTGFFFECTIGMVGFWMLEITSFLYVVNTVNFFVSGHMFPLDLLDPRIVYVLRLLPFQYLAYFPAMVFLGKIEGAELMRGLALEAAWVVVFFTTSRVLLRLGLRRYSAYGG